MIFTGDLLAGRRLAVAGLSDALAASLRGLQAELEPLGDLRADDAVLEAWCAARSPLHGVVVDTRGLAAAAVAAPPLPAAGADGLTAVLEHAWRAVRAVAVHALIPGGEGGRIILIGPGPASGPGSGSGSGPGLGSGPSADSMADAATAGLESLARTLSVEWARFQITAVCLAAGGPTTDDALGQLTAFLLSPGGGYASGCRFSLGLIRGS